VTVELVVRGVPAPQGSKSAVVNDDGSVTMLEGSSTSGRRRHVAWRAAVATAALQHRMRHRRTFAGEIEVEVDFVMPRLKRHPVARVWCGVKPDLDKLVRSTLDGLAEGGLFDHDQRVVAVTATKRYAGPGAPSGALIVVRDAPADADVIDLEVRAGG
jgi:Holliday junction resolvase RusA-like endonuclease